VKNATAGCAHLEFLQRHVRSFAKIMAQRRGTELPELRSLAAGILGRLPNAGEREGVTVGCATSADW
jgi:hypothetical protein